MWNESGPCVSVLDAHWCRALGAGVNCLTEIFTSPNVHHHVILSQLLEVGFVHNKQTASDHGCPAEKDKDKDIYIFKKKTGEGTETKSAHSDN